MADYSTLLRDHVRLTCRCIDRVFIQAWVPKLQSVGQVCLFLRWQRKFKIPSSAAFKAIGDGWVKDVERYAVEHDVPLVHFAKGQNKEEYARPLIDAAAAEGGDGRVVLIGVAQEKASAWKSWKAKGHEQRAHPHMEWGRQMVFVNHYYFYLWDPEFGPAFWKTNAFAPWPIWIYVNGHEWAKRQLDKAGIGYTALDNGFQSCDDPRALQRICDRLGSGAVKSFFWRWQSRLPTPFTRADLRTGYVYDLAFRQLEVSDTRVFDRPQAGRAFFEGLIRDHLDLGRPDQVALIFNRKIISTTPGGFRTKVITKGVDPQLSVYYKASRLKQYFKLGHALRTETVICDTRDFGIGRRVCAENFQALRAVGESANRRLCDVEAAAAHPAPDVATFLKVTRPSIDEGHYTPGLRFGEPRVMALLAALAGFSHVIAGFSNAQLTSRVAALLNTPYTTKQTTYDLRRLRRKGLITRRPHTHRYDLTEDGCRVVMLFTKAYGRVLAPGLAAMDFAIPDDVAIRGKLGQAWRHLHHILDEFIDAGLAAA